MPLRLLFGILIEVLLDWQVWVGALVFLSSFYLVRQVTKFDKKPKVRVKLPEELSQPSGKTSANPAS
ncbi:MAG: hypothetical protein SNJ78_02210 [Spirochaetales bacterium]